MIREVYGGSGVCCRRWGVGIDDADEGKSWLNKVNGKERVLLCCVYLQPVLTRVPCDTDTVAR